MKLNALEDLYGSLENDLKDKNSKISGLELKLEDLEKKQKSDKQWGVGQIIEMIFLINRTKKK